MENILNLELLNDILSKMYYALPKILGAIAFILIAWLCIKLILFLVKKSLNITRIDSLAEKMGDSENFISIPVKLKPSRIILVFVKWFLILIFVIIGADMFGLTIVSNEAGKLFAFLPRIFSSLLIFILGFYFAGMARKTVRDVIKSFDLNGSKAISLVVFYIILIVASITALNQAGINTDVITNNISLILGAFLASFTIALGLGSREVILRLLFSFYSRKNFEIGQTIKIDDFTGVILSIDNISMVVGNGHQKIVFPIKLIVNKKVEIIEG